MRITVKQLGIIALIIVSGFFMAACDEPADEETPPTPPVSGISSLTISGKVQIWDNGIGSYGGYSDYNGGNLKINDGGIGGTGAVTSGNLSYTVGAPPSNKLNTLNQEAIGNLFNIQGGYTVASSNVNNAKYYFLDKLKFAINAGNIAKQLVTFPSSTMKVEMVGYVYVDKNVTITGTGKEIAGWTINNFSLELKTGWNTFYYKVEEGSAGVAISVSLSNPSSLKLVLDDYKEPISLSLGIDENYCQISYFTRELFFKFDATASQHNIVFTPIDLNDVWVEVYNSSSIMVGERKRYNNNAAYTQTWTGLTSEQTYYIKVYPDDEDDGGYFNIKFTN